MKIDRSTKKKGSVLIIALMTITILTLICATSLYITSQNTGTGMQTAAWQQSLTGAEAGVDAAIRALNQNATTGANAWTNWKTVSTATLPTTEPTSVSSTSAAAPPTTSQYNYLPSSSLVISYPNTEGTSSVKAWVTIDTAGGLADASGSWYRIRSTGQVTLQSNSIYKRVSNNRLDNDLRNTLAMNFSRKGGTTLGPTRTIEAILQPVPQGGSARAITLATWLQMTGGGTVDAFSSPNGQWSSTFRDLSYPQLVAQAAPGTTAKFANANQTYVYGGMVYNGNTPPNTNTGNPHAVAGTASTPDNITIPPTSNPTAQGSNYNWTYINPWSGTTASYGWTPNGSFPSSAGTYATLTASGGNLPKNGNTTITSVTANGTVSSPALLIINGDMVVGGGKSFTINANTVTQNGVTVTDSTNSYLTVWVQGKFTVSGSGILLQAAGAHVTWIVDDDITVSGQSNTGYVNGGANAADLSIVGVGNIKVTDSGSAAFTGTINAPLSSTTLSGSGDYTGAIVATNMTISGSGSFHYDEALNHGSNPAIGNYAYASWFEDNSDPTHKDTNGNYIVY